MTTLPTRPRLQEPARNVSRSVDFAPRLHGEPVDYNKRFTRLGLSILLAPLYLPLLLAFMGGVFARPPVAHERTNSRTIEMPKPDDCGGCHYEEQFIRNRKTGQTIIEWRRVND